MRRLWLGSCLLLAVSAVAEDWPRFRGPDGSGVSQSTGLPAGARPQLVATGAHRVDGYDLETGEELWFVGRQGVYPTGSPVLFGDMVFAVSEGSDQPEYPTFDAMLAKLDKDKDGRISAEEWSHDADFTTLDPRSGAVLKTGRAAEAIDDYFASPVAADGKVFLLSHTGKLVVL